MNIYDLYEKMLENQHIKNV